MKNAYTIQRTTLLIWDSRSIKVWLLSLWSIPTYDA